jgi:phosphoserine phosphatase
LVRHGESSFNVERRVQGHCDESTLTETGQTGAHQVGQALSDFRFDAIFSSPLRRAKQTAEIIRSHLSAAPELSLRDTLKEINLVLWEALLFSEVAEKDPEGYRAWRNAPHTLKMVIPGPDGPQDYYPVPDLYEQAKTFWKETLPHCAGQTILIVAHSGINRALISTAIGLGCDRYQSVNQSNCGISVLNFAGGFGTPVQIESLNLTAHLGDRLPKPRKEYSGPRLLLVRHGETEWNRQSRFQGQIDVPLNENGQHQAQQAADFLQPIALRYAVTSPMLRPQETASIILQFHPTVQLELEDRLKEISHGLWEGKLEAEIEADFPGELRQWKQTPERVQMPEGENLQQVWDRATAAWDAIVQQAAARPEPGITLVVAHDAVNKAILCHVLGLGPESFWACKQGNGAVSVIDYATDLAQPPLVQALNITSHLAGGILDKTAAGAL